MLIELLPPELLQLWGFKHLHTPRAACSVPAQPFPALPTFPTGLASCGEEKQTWQWQVQVGVKVQMTPLQRLTEERAWSQNVNRKPQGLWEPPSKVCKHSAGCAVLGNVRLLLKPSLHPRLGSSPSSRQSKIVAASLPEGGDLWV